MDVELLDRQEQTVMLAVQGPAAGGHMARIIGPEVAALEKRACTELPFMQYKLFVSRTGYTGEDGFEIVTSPEAGRALWRQLLAEGVEPCGLGARDTLRLEAALPLWGNDIDETTNPYEAGLGWVVSLDDGADVRRPRRARAHQGGRRRAQARVPARRSTAASSATHYPILHDGAPVGTVASGGYSPTLGISIAMAYLPRALATDGTRARRSTCAAARSPPTVVPRPVRHGHEPRKPSTQRTQQTESAWHASPDDRKYSKEHEWVTIDGDAAAHRHHRLRAGPARRHRLRRSARARRHRHAVREDGRDRVGEGRLGPLLARRPARCSKRTRPSSRSRSS